jgi:hypothetical protein
MKTRKFNDVKPYCYILTRLSDEKKYFGFRWYNIKKNRSPNKDFGEFYFSSKKIIKDQFKKNPNKFKFKLVCTFDSIEEGRQYEVEQNKAKIRDPKWFNQQAYPAIINTKETIDRLTKLKIGRKVSSETRKRLSKSLTGRKVSKETRSKISKSQIGKKVYLSTRRKISKIQTGRKLTKKWKKNISKSLKGKQNRIGTKQSKIAKEKIALASTGRRLSQSAKNKISKKNKGRRATLETRKKLSQSHIGIKQSEETKLKRVNTFKKLRATGPLFLIHTKKTIIKSIKKFIRLEKRNPKSRDFLNKKLKKKYNLPSRDTIERNFERVSILLNLIGLKKLTIEMTAKKNF